MKDIEKKTIQKQLRQYLKSHRVTRGLRAEEAAKKLGIEIAAYRALEGLKPGNRVISALDYLSDFSSLGGLSLTEFISFLERNTRTNSGTTDMKRKLYHWEMILLEMFDQIGIPLRNSIIENLSQLEKDQIVESLIIFNKLSIMDNSRRDLIFKLIREFNND